MAAWDLTPPSVVDVGFGNCDGNTVPEISVNAGWLEEGAPLDVIAFIH
jgi:hypothetical protein